MRLELVMHHRPHCADVYVGTHGLPKNPPALATLSRHDAMRLARAIRNLVVSELAAIKAANLEASTRDKPDNLGN